MSEGGEPLPFSWEELVPLLIHPLRVAIIEALRRTDQPLSTADLWEVLDARYALSVISYHLLTLAKVEVVVPTHQDRARIGSERFFVVPCE